MIVEIVTRIAIRNGIKTVRKTVIGRRIGIVNAERSAQSAAVDGTDHEVEVQIVSA